MTRLSMAAALTLGVPAALIAGAYAFQWHGLVACEMCWWQRYPHFAAIAIGAIAVTLSAVRADQRILRAIVALGALAILASGMIGVYHAGVEYHLWEGHTACTSSVPFTAGMTSAQRLDALMRMPMIRCDTAQWTMLGVSLAGFNAIISTTAAAVIGTLALRRRAS